MTRDEVLDKIDRMADEANIDLARVESVGHWPLAVEKRKQEQALRAAAELIRQGGWRPIAEAPEWQSLIVGVWGERVGADGASVSHEWFVEAFQMKKHEAIREGYTHYLPEPEPPAREVPNDRG